MAKEGPHALRSVEHRVVHVDVDDRCAALNLCGGYGQGLAVFLFGYEPGEFARTGDVGAFPDICKVAAPVDKHWLQSAYCELFARFETAGSKSLDSICDGFDVRRRGAAASSDNVQQSFLGEPADDSRHGLRGVVVATHFIRYARVGIEAYGMVAEAGDFGDQRGHHVSAEGAVYTEGAKGGRMFDRAVEGFQGLAGQRTPAPVRNRRGNDEWQWIAEKFEGVNGCFCIEGVEAGFKDDQVRSAARKRLDLFAVRLDECVEAILAVGRVVGVRGERQGLAGGSYAAGDIDLAAGGVGHAARADRGLEGQVRRKGGLSLLRERYPVGVEAVGGDDVGSGIDIGAQYILLADALLEQGAHGPVKHEDAFPYVFGKSHQKNLFSISTVLSGRPIV